MYYFLMIDIFVYKWSLISYGVGSPLVVAVNVPDCKS